MIRQEVRIPSSRRSGSKGAQRIRASAAGLALALLATTSMAGPPYITDDPVPTDTGRWEIFSFTENSFDAGTTAGEAGFDLNYGAAENVQLTATLAVAYDFEGGDRDLADTEIGIKYRLLNDEAHGRQLAVFPKLVLPTAPGSGKPGFQFPVWAQQDFGHWSLFGGGGLTLQSDAGKRDFWEEGIALVDEFRDGLTIGVEVAHSGAEESGGHGVTTLDVAANFHIARAFSLVGAVGPQFEEGTDHTSVRSYLAVLANF